MTKPTLELLTLARRLGDPVAVVFGDGAEAAADRLGEYGATRVVAVTDPAIDEFLVAPKAEALHQLAAAAAPAAILISSSAEGKEIAGRLAVKLGSGLITDATDIAARRHDHPVGVRRQLEGHRIGHPGQPGDHGQAERARPRAGPGSPPSSRPRSPSPTQAKTARIVATRAETGQRPARS